MLLYGKKWKTWSVPKIAAKWWARCQRYLPWIKKRVVKSWMIEICDDHYEVDDGRARKNLNWTPKENLLHFISIWIEELKKDPLAWYEENKLKLNRKIMKKPTDF